MREAMPCWHQAFGHGFFDFLPVVNIPVCINPHQLRFPTRECLSRGFWSFALTTRSERIDNGQMASVFVSSAIFFAPPPPQSQRADRRQSSGCSRPLGSQFQPSRKHLNYHNTGPQISTDDYESSRKTAGCRQHDPQTSWSPFGKLALAPEQGEPWEGDRELSAANLRLWGNWAATYSSEPSGNPSLLPSGGRSGR